ncbi:MAG TPA: hypothetical protein VKT31_07885 [Solirubrobacteraceae bacterium]|nr:hypothetical protein [Solirubrobacteraceae bacterium]
MKTRLRSLAALAALALALTAPVPAHAAHSQVSFFEDDPGTFYDPVGFFQQLRLLGAGNVRVPVRWNSVLPGWGGYRRPPRFNASDPASSRYNWAIYDRVVRVAQQFGIGVTFDVMGPAPLWATGRGSAGHANWEPSAREYASFVRAVGTRYSGSFDPNLKRTVPGDPNDLPRVSSWSIWNEPDYGPSLAPQGLPGHLTIDFAPRQYRGLVDAAWGALAATGHRTGGRHGDTILFGELAPRGEPYWGVFSGMTPMLFLRSLYCLDSRYRPLRGSAAAVRGCPTTAAGRRGFRRAHPGLFSASGLAIHPYMRWYAPNHEPSPDPVTHQSTADYASMGFMGRLERGLDRMQRVYGSRLRLPIYNTEFGYITSPPKRPRVPRGCGTGYPYASPSTAAYYLNWAEYLSWRDPRVKSFMQYLLQDPLPSLCSNNFGGYASGLITYGGVKKPTYYAWRLPIFLPVTSTRRGRTLEVWGCARPAHYALFEDLGPQYVQIQSAPGSNPRSGAFTTVESIQINNPNNCYFDVRVPFPGHGKQTVRLVWSYPVADPNGYFDPLHPGGTAYSRQVVVNLR